MKNMVMGGEIVKCKHEEHKLELLMLIIFDGREMSSSLENYKVFTQLAQRCSI